MSPEVFGKPPRRWPVLSAAQWHLWLDLSGIKESDSIKKNFLLNAMVSPSGLLRTAVEMVVKFREARA